jgi:S-adenosylmethionine hydrolase
MPRPIITLLTDFGTADYYTGAMKGVMLGICPEAQLVDITHEIAPFQVGQGGWMLEQAWRCFPRGTVHLAVVDPGVGSERRPILAEADGHFFVAPDNGLLTQVLGGVKEPVVRAISATRYFREPVSRTFHGRDVFAPVAGHLAAGAGAAAFGGVVTDWVVRVQPQPVQVAEGVWEGEVLWVDHFGNLVTNFASSDFLDVLRSPFQFEIGNHWIERFAAYYGMMKRGVPYLVLGSAGNVEVSLNQGDAARECGVGAGARIRLLARLS